MTRMVVDEVVKEGLAVVNPSRGEVVDVLRSTTVAELDEIVNAASECVRNMETWKTPKLRGDVLANIARLLVENRTELALMECRDTGKPLSQGQQDVDASAAYFAYYAGWPDKWYGDLIPLGPEYVDYTLREPWGVCGQIIPWNYPLQVAARCAAPALACGNAVVLKPSENASLTPLRLQEIAVEAGLPAELFRVVIGAGELGSALVNHPKIDHVTFVGSAGVGQTVGRDCATRFVPCDLEMGGKSANIVFRDADLGRAIPVIVKALIQNAGQSCSAGSRVLVDEAIYDEVTARLVSSLEALSIGDGEEDLDLGPLITSAQVARVEGMLDRAVKAGARVLCGGRRPPQMTKGWYFEPTLVDQVAPQDEIFQEEVFGPVLVAAKFDGVDEAVALANWSDYGLVAGVWTSDLRTAHDVAARLEVGQVFVNSYGVGGGVALPFGGVKKSGFARGKGEAAMLAYSRIKNVCVAL
jgi:aldehyde dehydrogenase (NAD+)